MTTKAGLLRVIKLQCQECMGSTRARDGDLDNGAALLVEGCTAPECPLFDYRNGADPRPSVSKVQRGRKLGAWNKQVVGQNAQISTITH